MELTHLGQTKNESENRRNFGLHFVKTLKNNLSHGNRTHVTPIINGSFSIPKPSDRSNSVFLAGIGENGGIEMILL